METGKGSKRKVEETEDSEDTDDELPSDMQVEEKTKVWRQGVDPLLPGDVLEYDSSAYEMFHSLKVEWPCLSFDIMTDKLGVNRSEFPHTMYLATGTQANTMSNNQLMILKLSNLCRTTKDEEDETEEEEEEVDAKVDVRTIKHFGTVNRLRVLPQHPHIVATWASSSKVYIWNVAKHLKSLEHNESLPTSSPLHTFTKHKDEGWAMDWSNTNEGHLLTGDIQGHICGWTVNESGWSSTGEPYLGHTDSVEDIQWSPNEPNVFTSCSVDKTIKIWDTRLRQPALGIEAHSEDVNVISWNRNVSYLLVSGSDDGSFKIWDFRNFKADQPAAHFKWHQNPITSVEWHPSDESVVAVSSGDQLSLWDLSLEKDDRDETPPELQDVPPQLLFVHMGQRECKELHWHPQIPGVVVSTAADGFNIFKTINT